VTFSCCARPKHASLLRSSPAGRSPPKTIMDHRIRFADQSISGLGERLSHKRVELRLRRRQRRPPSSTHSWYGEMISNSLCDYRHVPQLDLRLCRYGTPLRAQGPNSSGAAPTHWRAKKGAFPEEVRRPTKVLPCNQALLQGLAAGPPRSGRKTVTRDLGSGAFAVPLDKPEATYKLSA
jgi:hypothetical protein